MGFELAKGLSKQQQQASFEDFSAMLGDDLKKRNSEVAKKYDFDFSSGQPAEASTNPPKIEWTLCKTTSMPVGGLERPKREVRKLQLTD